MDKNGRSLRSVLLDTAASLIAIAIAHNFKIPNNRAF
jgi:hypothetical protein